MKKKETTPVVAKTIVEAMATWSFIILFLIACVIEIVGNKIGIFQFDPTMLVLNTVLSLLAAIQGSVIMIYQKYADAERDKMLETILRLEKKIERKMDNGKPKIEHK